MNAINETGIRDVSSASRAQSTEYRAQNTLVLVALLERHLEAVELLVVLLAELVLRVGHDLRAVELLAGAVREVAPDGDHLVLHEAAQLPHQRAQLLERHDARVLRVVPREVAAHILELPADRLRQLPHDALDVGHCELHVKTPSVAHHHHHHHRTGQ